MENHHITITRGQWFLCTLSLTKNKCSCLLWWVGKKYNNAGVCTFCLRLHCSNLQFSFLILLFGCIERKEMDLLFYEKIKSVILSISNENINTRKLLALIICECLTYTLCVSCKHCVVRGTHNLNVATFLLVCTGV